mmetsp:Transcript_17930/g.19960  ORF Transcript_17930/g.19960 Transcript_17930/m.19960 type:complete len:198 (-) Transcript_17930:74-667(-)
MSERIPVSVKHHPNSKFSRDVTFLSRGTKPSKTLLVIRPITPDDEIREKMFVEKHMSPHSRYMRFFHAKTKLTPKEVHYFTHVDYTHDFALAAVDSTTDSFVGIARYMSPKNDGDTCEMAVTVADKFQGRGIATYITKYLLEIAAMEGKKTCIAETMPDNIATQRLFDRVCGSYAHSKTLHEGCYRWEIFLDKKPES